MWCQSSNRDVHHHPVTHFLQLLTHNSSLFARIYAKGPQRNLKCPGFFCKEASKHLVTFPLSFWYGLLLWEATEYHPQGSSLFLPTFHSFKHTLLQGLSVSRMMQINFVSWNQLEDPLCGKLVKLSQLSPPFQGSLPLNYLPASSSTS